MGSERLKGHLDSLILAVLEESPCHGYAVIEQLRARSGDFFDLPEGTVYPALHRLERTGLVASESQSVGGRKRRVYRLSRRGRSALSNGRDEWRQFSSAVASILGAKA